MAQVCEFRQALVRVEHTPAAVEAAAVFVDIFACDDQRPDALRPLRVHGTVRVRRQ